VQDAGSLRRHRIGRRYPLVRKIETAEGYLRSVLPPRLKVARQQLNGSQVESSKAPNYADWAEIPGDAGTRCVTSLSSHLLALRASPHNEGKLLRRVRSPSGKPHEHRQ